jgi:hypothetical protein
MVVWWYGGECGCVVREMAGLCRDVDRMSEGLTRRVEKWGGWVR